MATPAPAGIINRAPKIGTLQLGAPGDVAIMDLVEGPVTFVDTRNNKRDGQLQLKPVQTVINGVPLAGPIRRHSRFASLIEEAANVIPPCLSSPHSPT